MFESDFCKIEYIEKYNAVFCKWKKICKSDDYRNPLEFGLKLIKEKNTTVWITDTTNGFESEPEDAQWLLENFIPKTIESSCDTIIFIIKNNSPLKNEIDEQTKVLSQYFNVKQIENLDKISPIQHYVSKMFIRRFMNGRTRLHTLSIDSSDMKYGNLKKSFGKKHLWTNTTEDKITKIENKINNILQAFDKEEIIKQPQHKCTAWEIDNLNQKNIITKMALLQPKLLKDLKNSKDFEKNILEILDNDYSTKKESVFYIKLYEEYCNGKFLITDYLGQAFLEDPISFNSIPTFTIEELKSGSFKSIKKSSSIPLANYFITGEYELFFVGKKEQLHNFLGFLRKPTICFVDKDDKEYEYKKKKIDSFELTTFNLNEIKAQESQCEVGSYDEEYLTEIQKILPNIVSNKVMWRATQCVHMKNQKIFKHKI